MGALSPTASRDEARALLVLDALPGVGLVRVQELVSAFGSARSALTARARRFQAVAGSGTAAARRDPEILEAVDGGLARAARLGMDVVTWSDERYPPRLRRLADPPPVLFLRGRAELLGVPGVAVVGARRATTRGRDVSRRLGRALGAAGATVVSGLALGVDGAAHAGALEAGGDTVAVMGRGADRAYPRSHTRLFRKVVEEGLVVSEFLPGTGAKPFNFPRRNRILAALAHSVVVVEAGDKSGSLITVDHALALGLDVYSVPGPIDSRTCLGSNRLLVDGARPLVSVDEFVAQVAPPAQDPSRPDSVPLPLIGPEADVLRALDAGPCDVDGVARETGLPPARALGVLTRLELEGLARRLPGQRFRRAG